MCLSFVVDKKTFLCYVLSDDSFLKGGTWSYRTNEILCIPGSERIVPLYIRPLKTLQIILSTGKIARLLFNKSNCEDVQILLENS